MLLGGSAGLALGSLPISRDLFAQSTAEVIQDVYVPRAKYALLIGNRDYPNRKDIAPAHKNVRDLKDVLEYYEFKVSDYRDLDAAAMKRTLAEFGAQMRTVGES
ncbi:MAG: caspase family protein, partial [Proteobacteria bacterium]|nr:caspase family protein [Pseudomonadota bacterium]